MLSQASSIPFLIHQPVFFHDTCVLTVWHGLLCRSSADLKEQVDGGSLLLGLNQDLSSDHLCKYAPHGPHIYCEAVVSESEKKFRRTIPQRDNSCRVVCIHFLRVEDPSETKVSDLDLAFS